MDYVYMIICPYNGLWCIRASTPRHEFLEVRIVPTCRHIVARLLSELRRYASGPVHVGLNIARFGKHAKTGLKAIALGIWVS